MTSRALRTETGKALASAQSKAMRIAPDEEAYERKTHENARHIVRFGFPVRAGPR